MSTDHRDHDERPQDHEDAVTHAPEHRGDARAREIERIWDDLEELARRVDERSRPRCGADRDAGRSGDSPT